MAYEYVNSFLLLLHPHFLIKNGGEADIIYLNKNVIYDSITTLFLLYIGEYL